MPSSRVPAWPECAVLPAGFASGAELGREGDAAALRDALAELSRARETCASSLARALDAPDLRPRARDRASWTTLLAANAPAPAPPTSTARGDASGAAPPPDDPVAPDASPARSRETRSPPGAPASANARESPQPTPMCTQPPPAAIHAVDAESDDVVAATPDADLGRSDDATHGGRSRSRSRSRSTSVGSKRRRPASTDARSADRRETRSASARRRAERPSPSLDASLDAPESAYRRLASSQLRGAYSLDESDEFAAAKRVAAEPTATATATDADADADPDESAPTPAATLPRAALTLTTVPASRVRGPSPVETETSARAGYLADSTATRVEETPAADARTRAGGGGRRIRFSVGATGETHAHAHVVEREDVVAEDPDGAADPTRVDDDVRVASETTCVLRVKFEASSVRGVAVSRDAADGGANVAVVVRRDASVQRRDDDEVEDDVAEILAWRVGASPSRATLLGSVRFRLRDDAERTGDAGIRTVAPAASPTSAAALFRARADSSPSRPRAPVAAAFDADAVAVSANGEWMAIPSAFLFDAETTDGVCVCRVVAPERPAANPLADIASAMNAEGRDGDHFGGGFSRTSSRMDGASLGKSRSRRRSSARLNPHSRRRTVALACSFPVTRLVASPDGSWLVGFGAEGRARAWRVGDEPSWAGTRTVARPDDSNSDPDPDPAFSHATRRGVALPPPTFSEERIAPRGDAPDAACFSPEGDALVGVFDGGMRATWHVPVAPRDDTWTLRGVTFDAERDVLALAVARAETFGDEGGVEDERDASRPLLAAALTRARTDDRNAREVSAVAGVIAPDGRVVLGGDLGVSNPTVACAATNAVVVVGADDGTVRAWSLETGRAAGNPGDLRGAAVTHARGCGLAGGREGYFAAAAKDGRVACYRVVAAEESEGR